MVTGTSTNLKQRNQEVKSTHQTEGSTNPSPLGSHGRKMMPTNINAGMGQYVNNKNLTFQLPTTMEHEYPADELTISNRLTNNSIRNTQPENLRISYNS